MSPGCARRAASDGEFCDVLVESLAAGGDAVAHAPDGRVIFIPLAAPGDRVRVRIRESHARYLRADIEQLIEAGAARREPRCPAFGHCGGCSWQHVDEVVQQESKCAILREALVRVGGCSPSQLEVDSVASSAEYAYRARARVLSRGGRVGYRERRSHRLCGVRACPVLAQPLERELDQLAERLSKRRSRAECEWELAMGGGGETRVTRLRRGPHARPTARAAQIVLCPESDPIWISPGTFSQANSLLFAELRQAVASALGSGVRALELHAGAGFFTLGLARRFETVTAVESASVAVADLRRNLARAGLSNVRVIRERVEAHLLSAADPGPEVVLLDPPRVGLPGGACRALAALGASRIVYLSCDPATVSRDVRQLCEAGYGIADVRAFDLFPQTPHVEALVVLERT